MLGTRPASQRCLCETSTWGFQGPSQFCPPVNSVMRTAGGAWIVSSFSHAPFISHLLFLRGL